MFHQFYTYVRYRAAVQLKKDMNGTIRYKLVGRNWENERLVKNGYIQPEVYKQVNQFFEEFTGGSGKPLEKTLVSVGTNVEPKIIYNLIIFLT